MTACPKGEVEIRGTNEVMSTDGHHLGHVDGFGVDGGTVTLSLTLAGVRAQPAVPVRRRPRPIAHGDPQR